MAPRGSARARDYDYSNLGKAGRRTGITLKEGKLDEHGMEELEGMFSSSPEPEGRDNANGTLIDSEGMQIDESSGPDPREYLSRRPFPRESLAFPPRARSPRKSFISGSPRRTPILRSSPNQRNGDYSSPLTSRGTASKASSRSNARDYKPQRSFVDSHDAEVASESEPEPLPEPQGAGDDYSDDDAGNGTGIELNGVDQEESLFVQDYDTGADAPQENGFDETNNDFGADESNLVGDAGDMNDTNLPEEPETSKTGSKRKNADSDAQDQQDDGARRRGKPAKGSRDRGQERARPTKKPRTAPAPLSEAEHAERMEQAKRQSLFVLRREPSQDAALRTRSGRISVRPLAWWRNERFVYGDDESSEDDERFPKSKIKEIIRTEEAKPERPHKRSRKGQTKKRSRVKRERNEPSDDETAADAEPWETTGGGVFFGPIRQWDSSIQMPKEEEEVMDIAYAPVAVQTQPVKDATFKFAKIVSTPFLGSGFVDMPPEAVKRTKNSKKMHMVFYMVHGRVTVEVAGLQFSAGKGTVFQVPRGNNYSFTNNSNKPAKLFFTQGCVQTGGEEAQGNTFISSTAPSSDAAAESGARKTQKKAPAKKGRSRATKGK